MKTILSLVLLLGLTSKASAYSIQQLEGKYKVSSTTLKMENILTIDKTGNLKLFVPSQNFKCAGKAKIDASDMINASIKCVGFFDKRVFDFKIDMTKVRDLNRFTAPLIFPMIGETSWNFERLSN